MTVVMLLVNYSVGGYYSDISCCKNHICIIVVLFLKLWKAQYLEASLVVGTEMRNARLEYVADLIEKVT